MVLSSCTQCLEWEWALSSGMRSIPVVEIRDFPSVAKMEPSPPVRSGRGGYTLRGCPCTWYWRWASSHCSWFQRISHSTVARRSHLENSIGWVPHLWSGVCMCRHGAYTLYYRNSTTAGSSIVLRIVDAMACDIRNVPEMFQKCCWNN